MEKFTFLELHLHDASFTANAPYSGEAGASPTVEPGARADAPDTDESDAPDADESDAPDADESDAADADESRSRSRAGSAVAGFLALVVVAVLLRRLIGGADSEVGDTDSEPVDVE